MSKPKIPLPPPRRQLQLEAEGIKRKMEEMKSVNNNKAVTALAQELVKRKDLFRILAGEPYEVPIDVSPAEKEGLFRVFTSLAGCTWRKTSGWVGLTQSLTRPQVNVLEGAASLYDGVKLQRVFESLGNLSILDIGGFGCDGSLPHQIGQLKGLRKLDMTMNQIRGNIPSSIGELKKIEILDLSCNAISGEIEAEWFSEISRKALSVDLSFNAISGRIPDAFDKFGTLVSLNLSGNSFVGPLPTSFSSLKSLNVLKLYHNDLSGDLPDVFATCPDLVEVNLSKNKFTGDPLKVFANNISLKKLILNDNLFDSSFHVSCLRKLEKLEILYLQNNQLSGIIGDEICTLLNLKMFNASNNRLHGLLPDNFGDLINLEVCVLSNNSIVGPVPRSMSQITKLKDFHIFNQWASETLFLQRKFTGHIYKRLYVDALRMGMDSLCWVSYDQKPEFSSGDGDLKKSTRKRKSKKKSRHRQTDEVYSRPDATTNSA